MTAKLIITWLLRFTAVIIIGMTLYFKFSGHPQSVRLFTALGMEPWGRIGTGIFEVIACILLLNPKTTGWGALLGCGLMAGAIFFHLTKLGIKFEGDYVLFTEAVVAFVSCLLLLVIYRVQVLRVLPGNHPVYS